MTSELVVETRDLCKRFVDARRGAITRAVDGVNLLVSRGETFGLLGADGAGKTTTLRLLTGLLRPSQGTARVLGLDTCTQARDIHLRAGYMPQQFALYGDMSVMENLDFYADSYGLDVQQKHERLPRLLDFARLTPFRTRLAAQLSGGMKKKLALACMLVHDPEIVFLDEPTLGVDPVSRREFWTLLSDLRAERGLTIFVCTPYMDEAERCHRVGLLYEGKLIAEDTPEAIKHSVSGELLELRPVDFHAARDIVRGLEGVLEVQTYGDLLHVFVDHAALRAPQIEMALRVQDIALSGLRAIAPRMEEAFVSLMRKERQRDGQDGGTS